MEEIKEIAESVREKEDDGYENYDFFPVIKRYHDVVGILALSYKADGSPEKFCLTTAINYVTDNCVDGWLETLDETMKKMQITHVIIVGKRALDIAGDVIGRPQISVDEKASLVNKCKDCESFSCEIMKAQLALKRALSKFSNRIPHSNEWDNIR